MSARLALDEFQQQLGTTQSVIHQEKGTVSEHVVYGMECTTTGYEAELVSRVENSDTHRHLTEYTGVDNGAAIEEHYHEALNTIDGVQD